jgi:uncharacterized 2Fe-2S/4Fe-4S cluster protein (DUF4445 family)
VTAGDLNLALDLGTTTLGGRLLDGQGACLVESEVANPQRAIGADVIRRLEASLAGEGKKLQALLVEGIETLTDDLLSRAGRSRRDLGTVAVAGNSAVSYLLRNLPVQEILFPPHRPAHRAGVLLAPAEVGLALPVPLYLFPLVSGYVGGDLVAFLYAQARPEPNSFYLDVGTNGEMAVHTAGGWQVTSVAAGPAFEGGEISCGMNCRPGAVTSVRVAGDRLKLQVIGDVPPRGICGSGLVEAVAAALEAGLVDGSGRILEPGQVATNLARYLVETPAGSAVRFYRDAATDLCLTQQDIRQFQLAKGAIRAGTECLLQRAGVEPGDLSEVVVTGAFGFSLPTAPLKRVALLPANMVDKVRFTAGGVLEGLSRFFQDPEGPGNVQRLSETLRPYPLSGTPAFQKAFLNALNF